MLPPVTDTDVAYFEDKLKKVILFKPGQIHELPARRQVVRLRAVTSWLGDHGSWWSVEDVVSGDVFYFAQRGIGRQLTEMEILAWAAA